MHLEVISPQTLNTLKSIFANSAFGDFYLVGGTGLASQLGHRKSEDVDLFSPCEFSVSLLAELKKMGAVKVILANDNAIEVSFNGVRVFLMYFDFPLYKPLKTSDGVVIADAIDIGLMKLLSLTGRDSKKDIIDLYFIDKEVIKLEKLLGIMNMFYPPDAFNGHSSLKNLFDEDKLNAQPMPKMVKSVEWQDAYERVSTVVVEYLRGKLK
ncbi:nucleotidyl transferase AbiEii/AbiGii toxin family protein [Patescibacteria group bacterium]|nr:nucleotidyl transferase AbiEii/AbiGii toxin family protein [Patescibacteria group bacterium]